MAEFHDIPDFLGDASLPPGKRLGTPLPAGGAPPTRAELRRRRARALTASGAWFFVQLAAFGVRPGLLDLPADYLVALIVTPLAAGLLAVVASVHPGRLGLGLRTPLLVALALLAPSSFVLVALATPLPANAPGVAAPGMFCANAIMGWSVLPLVLSALVLRRSFVSGAAYRSALLGGGIGLVSGALFALHCPDVDRIHVALGHGAAIAFAGLAGGLVIARFTRL